MLLFRTRVKAILLPLLLVATFFTAAGAARAQNQIIYDDALENGWVSYGWATLNFSNTSPVHSGSDSISVIDPGSSYEALYLDHSAFNPSLYQSLTFWVYPTAAKTNELLVQATLSGNPQAAYYLSFTTAQVNHWQQVTIPLSTLGVAGNANFDGFWIQNNTGGALTWYVDDISLVAVAPPNPVPLTVNPQTVVRTIDARTYGVNIDIWDSSLNSTATNTLLATMGTGAVRFPGGSASDNYDWSTDKNQMNGTFQWANNAATFATITATAGAQAYVTVNYGSGTPQEAAAWVAYYNGNATDTLALGTDATGRNWKTVGFWAALRGAAPLGTDDGYNFLRISHPAPFALKYWEIGNECYGSWETDLHGTSGSGLSGSPQDPYTYAQWFAQFHAAMLAVDPTIHLGAVATPGEDSYGIGTHAVPNPAEGNSLHTGWTPVMLVTLQSLGVTPHFLIDHIYPQEPGNESDAVLLQAGSTTASDATNLRTLITDYVGGATGAGIELAVTELNSVSNNPGKQTTSLVNGLFLVDAIGQLAQTEINACLWWDLRNGANTSGNNSSSLYGWRTYGDYGFVASGDVSGTPANTPYPAYYAANLLASWGHGGDRVISASSTYSLLSIYGAKLQNGNLALLVINKHPTLDLPAQVTLNNFTAGSATATVYSYGKPNDTANSGLTTGSATVSAGAITYTFPSYSMSVVVVKSQFEAWREEYFNSTQLSNWSLTGDTGEPAGDGIPNLLKYAFGLNPNVLAGPSSLPSSATTVVAGKKYLTLSFTDLASLTDITYTVQVSSDLIHWFSGSSYAIRTDNGSTSTATYQDLTPMQGTTSHFLRLSITRP